MKIQFLPIHILIVFLSLLALGACFSLAGSDRSVWLTLARNAASLAISGSALFFVFQKLNLAAPARPEHRIITYLILFLLFDPLLPWWLFFALGTTTELLQRLIRTASGPASLASLELGRSGPSLGGPIFNPAALGGLLFSLLSYAPSWWGVSYAPRLSLFGNDISIAAFFTLILGGYVAYRYRKLPIILATLITFCISYFILFGIVPLFVIIEGTLAFFLFVMAVEPKTSPVLKNEQYIYGSFIGIFISLGLSIHFPEAFLGALVIANLYYQRHFLKTLFFEEQKTALQ